MLAMKPIFWTERGSCYHQEITLLTNLTGLGTKFWRLTNNDMLGDELMFELGNSFFHTEPSIMMNFDVGTKDVNC